MSARGHHGILLGAGASSLATLIASLSPVTWLRLNDNAANSTVADSSVAPGAGTLYAAINSTARFTQNTNTRSDAGLVTGDGNKAFDFRGDSMVESPNRALSDATGWTVFCIAKPNSAPVAASSNVGVIFQLSVYAGGVPELDIYHAGTGIFRLRAMLSGTSEITMSATPTWAYGTKLAICFKKEASGYVKLFVNGVHIATSTSAPSFSYAGGIFRWGAARFGPSTPSTYYQFPGQMDELTVFNTPLSDSICAQLTTVA